MDVALAQKERIRNPVGAGMFYPEDRNEMLEFIRTFNLEAGKGGRAKAIIAPHGAWDFSGSLAANAFSAATGRSYEIKRVVILGPIHDKRENGIFLSNSHSFYTPLGNIPVDQEITDELEFTGNYFEIDDIPHLGEHSIEILLPFVKYCFPYASIVPILMGQAKAEYIKDLANALKSVITPVLDETLLVVSCNLSCSNNITTAQVLAEQSMRLFSEKDASGLASALLEGRINPCGGSLVVSLLESGLLDGKCLSSSADYMVSAVSAAGTETENDTVFYSAISFG
jgi:AmmeMemoRadiSam system protein B